jgi:hypothetical protein
VCVCVFEVVVDVLWSARNESLVCSVYLCMCVFAWMYTSGMRAWNMARICAFSCVGGCVWVCVRACICVCVWAH